MLFVFSCCNVRTSSIIVFYYDNILVINALSSNFDVENCDDDDDDDDDDWS